MFQKYYFWDGVLVVPAKLKDFPVEVQEFFKEYSPYPLIVIEGVSKDGSEHYRVFMLKNDGSLYLLVGSYSPFNGSVAYLNEKAYKLI